MLLSVQGLSVSFAMGRGAGEGPRFQAVQDVSFDIPENSTVALVGESGSGKSVTAMSIVGLLPESAQCGGEIRYRGQGLLSMPAAALRRIRGREIACIFQDPMSSLNPVLTVGQQVCEPLTKHLGLSRRQASLRAQALLSEVGLAEPQRRIHAYPHQLSGGQQQRVMIAMALACEPRLLIADEPTTALDMTVQQQILELLATLKARHRMSMLFISHDLGLVSDIADEVVVMRRGQVREHGGAEQIFCAPQDAYTQALLACRPSLTDHLSRLSVIDDPTQGRPSAAAAASPKDPHAPAILQVVSLSKSYWIKKGLVGRRAYPAVRDVTFMLRKGHTLGVVGESGSGKTTLGMTLLRLNDATGGPVSGAVTFAGDDLLGLTAAQLLPMRRRLQVVFQNPYASLNPRFTVGQALIEPMRIHGLGADAPEREQRARILLKRVGLDEGCMQKYPHEFSGGQRQRVAIARCLTLDPEVIVLDEAVSALDVSVQAQVLNLLKDLQDELGLAYLFISHDLAVVRFMADDVMVMKDGAVVEHGSVAQILQSPTQAYTRTLLAAVPRGRDRPSPTARP